MATRKDPPRLVVVTDYPDDGILGNLKENVSRNSSEYSPKCTVHSVGYNWGTDPSHLKHVFGSCPRVLNKAELRTKYQVFDPLKWRWLRYSDPFRSSSLPQLAYGAGQVAVALAIEIP
ncbi:hypothetical protein PM082_012034 [Marasmius tenuissimus]|nr:hypothetical protein PM082_012034 [Marasmius tenuissimus]